MQLGPLMFAVVVLFSACAAGAEPALKFTDVEIEGNKIAFVCDGSRWTKNKADELGDELVRAVEAMPAGRQFAVIFFADGKTFGPNDGKPMPTTEENKRKLKNWLEDLEVSGEPTPLPGLIRAFEGRPDAVVFISDGHFENYDEVEKQAAALNPKAAARVYAIGFFRNEKEDDSRSFAEFMQRLAARNRGTFKAVYADELKTKSR